MTLPQETIDKINKLAAYYSGYDENKDCTSVSKGRYYGYLAAATEWAGKAEGLIAALEKIKNNHPASAVSIIATDALAKYKEVGI